MASQTLTPAAAHSAQVVGHAFVEQYYHILHQSPETVHKFYQDSSLVSRPEPNGVMTTVTTMQAINEKILSLDYNNLKAEIKTADAQDSYMGGVTVLVTGCLTGMDDVKKPFSQSFFLAPQDKGYYVLNDVFRYVDESESTSSSAVANGVRETAPRAPLTLDPEPAPTVDHHVMDHATPISEEYMNNGAEVCDPSENEEGSVAEEEVVEEASNLTQNEVQQVASTSVTDDTIKQSYASIVKVTKDSNVSSAAYVPATTVKVVPRNTERQPNVPSAPAVASEAAAVATKNISESGNLPEEVEGHSIYIGGLPLSATVAQLEEEFKKFGPIKPNGIQVRSNKAQGFCFGFIEFESSSSMHSAIEASPIPIGGRQAFVEEKKTTSRGGAGGGGRGRFSPGRGNFRNDGFRGRGNYGGRGYGRNDFGNRGDYSGRPRGSSGRSGEGYQRVDQNGNGRIGRSGGVGQTAGPA